MDVTKPYEFIGFGAMDVTKPYEFIGFGAMDVTKPYEFIGFRAGHPLRRLLGKVSGPSVAGQWSAPLAPAGEPWHRFGYSWWPLQKLTIA